jgi:Domain of unknown function (DUF4331)
MKKLTLALGVLAALVAAIVAAPFSSGSSHREAPNIMLDPSADNTDTYAFTAKDAPDALTVVANWVPGGNPANGPNFFRFDDRARYYINIDNNGDGKADLRYRYVFRTQVGKDSYRQSLPNVQSFGDPKLLQKQYYDIVRETLTDGKPSGEKEIANNLPVAPSNAGPKSFPDYAKVAAESIRSIGSSKYFVGQRNDAFFIDLGTAFDQVNVRQGSGNTGGGIDTQAGTSIQTITMQVPESEVTSDGKQVSGPTAPNAVVGVWASTERRKIEVTNNKFDDNKRSRGSWVQVSRLGIPLTNELFIPADRKDEWNRNRPQNDGRFVRYFETPEFAKQLNSLDPAGSGAGSARAVNAPENNRSDLVEFLLNGIAGLNRPAAGPQPYDTLKLNLATPPAQTPNRFGVLGGDNAGFPNGRRLEDDVVDIYVQLYAGSLKGNKLPLGDGVDQDDQAFLPQFPYQSQPASGFANPVSDRKEPTHAPTAPDNNPSGPSLS